MLALTKLDGTSSETLNRLCFSADEFLVVDAIWHVPAFNWLYMGFLWGLDPLTLVTCTFSGYLTVLPNTICVATVFFELSSRILTSGKTSVVLSEISELLLWYFLEPHLLFC